MFRMIEAAAACVRHSAPKRPRMAQVIPLPNSFFFFFLAVNTISCFFFTIENVNNMVNLLPPPSFRWWEHWTVKVKCLISLMGWNMVRALYMILANTIMKFQDSGGWQSVAIAQNMTCTVENSIIEKHLDLNLRRGSGMLQVVNQKLEPLIHIAVITDMAMGVGFN